MYTCRCCGYKALDEGGGSYEICPICFWEDDNVQNVIYDMAGGANKVSLREAQHNFREFGVSEPEFLEHVRKPTAEDERDPDFHYIEYSVEDAQRWGERLAGLVDEFYGRIADQSTTEDRYVAAASTAWSLLHKCEWVYREYRYPEQNIERRHVSTPPVEAYEVHAWLENQLANWVWFKKQAEG